jgi:thiamine transport system permease protein
MASRRSLSTTVVQAIIACTILLGLVPLFWLVLRDGTAVLKFDPTIFSVLLFTLKQATLSSVISILLGVFTARALARRDFLGRQFILNCFALPMAVPAIVAVLGLTTLFGQSGLLPKLITLYGLPGIVLAHVFFNLPMTTRMFFQSLQTVQPENFRLAAQLNFNEAAVFKHVEWPVLRGVLPSIAALIFLLCAASFVIVLTLGGASATTLEVAIYQSLRLDFDLPRALQLSLIQIVLCVALVWAAARAFTTTANRSALRTQVKRFDPQNWIAKSIDIAFIMLALAVVLPPLVAILAQGIFNLHLYAETLRAMGTSLIIAGCSGVVAVLLAWPLAKTASTPSHIMALAAFIVPPAVLATGWFLLIYRYSDNFIVTLGFIITLNGLMALPLTTAALRVGFARISTEQLNLAAQLGFSKIQLFRLIELPILKPHLVQSFLLALVLSLGDLTAVMLLGNNGIVTLPTLLHNEMGHYRSNDAAGTALLLLFICAALTFLAEKSGARNDHV